MNESRNSARQKRVNEFALVLIAVALVKLLLAGVTVSQDTETFATQFLSGSIFLRLTPWGFLNWLMYQAWFALPIDKSELLLNPDSVKTISAGSVSLLLILKIPALCLDFLTGVALYKYVKQAVSMTAASKVALAWFANPFATLAIEMWGSLAILPASLFALALLTFARRRVFSSAALQALTLAVAPILAIVIPVLWVHLARTRNWRNLVLNIFSLVVGIGGYVRWTTDLGADPYKLLRTDTPFSLGLTDFFADPLVLFGANIGIGTSLALGYIIYTYFSGDEYKPPVVETAYATLAIIVAFGSWSLTFPLVVIPYLCLLLKAGLSKTLPRITIFLIAILTMWTILAGAPQLFRTGASFFFIPAGDYRAWLGLPLQRLLENSTTVFLLVPFLRSVLLAGLLVVAARSRTLSPSS